MDISPGCIEAAYFSDQPLIVTLCCRARNLLDTGQICAFYMRYSCRAAYFSDKLHKANALRLGSNSTHANRRGQEEGPANS